MHFESVTVDSAGRIQVFLFLAVCDGFLLAFHDSIVALVSGRRLEFYLYSYVSKPRRY